MKIKWTSELTSTLWKYTGTIKKIKGTTLLQYPIGKARKQQIYQQTVEIQESTTSHNINNTDYTNKQKDHNDTVLLPPSPLLPCVPCKESSFLFMNGVNRWH